MWEPSVYVCEEVDVMREGGEEGDGKGKGGGKKRGKRDEGRSNAVPLRSLTN